MPSSDHHHEVTVGLVSQAAAVNEHLKQALAELGAQVVYDAPASSFDFGALDASGAEVVIVNLDPEVEEFDALGDLLADERRRVVINDGEVSSKLSGWDQARWARHLAAKVLGKGDLNPPRPAGAEAIPVVSKPAAPEYPGSTADDTSFEFSAADLERAMAADTGHALAVTKAELVTAHEPTPITLQERDESLRDAGLEVGFDDVPQLDDTPVEREAQRESGFAMLEEPAAAPATGAASKAGDDFAEFGDFGGLLLETNPESPVAEAPTVVAEPVASEADEFDLGGFSLELEADDSIAEAPASAAKSAPAAAPADDMDFGGFSLEPLAEPEPSPDERLSTLQKVAARAAPTVEIPLEELKKAQRQAAPTVQIPAAELKQAAKPAADDFDFGGFSLEPLTDEPAAPPPAPAPTPAAKSEPKPAAGSQTKAGPGPATPTSEWDSIGAFSLEPLEEESKGPTTPRDLGGFSLEPFSESAAAPAAPPKPAPAAAPQAARPAAPPAAPKPAPAAPPVAAAKPAAPAAPKPAPPPAVPPESNAALAGLDLDFAEAGDTFKFSDFAAEPEPTVAIEADDELMKQFQAIFDDEEYVAPETGPLQRVWVLGASIGGPEAVREFLAALPPNLPVLFLLAQHMGSDFVDLMTQQLSKATKYRVRHVADGDMVAHGEVLVVPLAERLRVAPSGETRVSALEQVSSYTPSIDTVLKDVADAFGKNAGAIIFSGMAHDAIEGAKYLHAKGGQVWAQDPKTCVVSSMVDGAVDAGVVTVKAPPAELAQRFAAMFAGK